MSVPKFKLVDKDVSTGYRRTGIDWDEFLDGIPPGKKAEFDRDSTFENNVRGMLNRRQKNKGRLDYSCFAKGDKFYIARKNHE